MQVCDSTEYAAAWQASFVSPGAVSDRSPVSLNRLPRQSDATALAGRSYVRFATVAWIAACATLAAVPWLALAWMFIAD